MTYKEKNIMFIKLKNELIEQKLKEKEITYPKRVKPYLLPEDIEEMESWPEEEHKEYWSRLNNDIKDGECDLSGSLCFFCLKYHRSFSGFSCSGICTYGRRHGTCVFHIESSWIFLQKIINIKNAEYCKIIDKIEKKSRKS